MKDKCSQIKEKMLDSFENDFSLNGDVIEHISTCTECRENYNELIKLNTEISIDTIDFELDYKLVSMAVDEGFERIESKTKLFSTLLFIFAGILLLILVGVAIGSGYSYLIVAIQGLMIMFSPVIIPFVISFQVKGGSK